MGPIWKPPAAHPYQILAEVSPPPPPPWGEGGGISYVILKSSSVYNGLSYIICHQDQYVDNISNNIQIPL